MVLFLDLDDFKYINDLLGHQKADKLLVQISQRIRETIRETDCRVSTVLCIFKTQNVSPCCLIYEHLKSKPL